MNSCKRGIVYLLAGRTNFYLTERQMYIPPWLLAFIVLVMVAAMGVGIMRSFHGLPENFVNEVPNEVPNEVAEAEAVAEAVPEASASTNIPSDPTTSVKTFTPSTKEQPIGIAASPYVAADAHVGPEFDSYLQQIKSRVGNPMIPSQDSLEMISGGPSAPTNETLVMGYMPNQEKILPHELPPQRQQAITANVPLDVGTDAENIQTNSPALRTIRENVRGDPKNIQGFVSPSAITYVHT